MAEATNIDATAVNTMGWLSATTTTIVVPVYQRQYRWDIDGCEQLLADVRAVAESDDRHTHFIGSILGATSAGTDELVLIDGQQRITTLMLLLAALQHTAEQSGDHEIAAQLRSVLLVGDSTKLRPHRAWAEVFERVVLDRGSVDGESRESRFDDNYAFFRSQIPPEEVPSIWAGLQRLEHVSITLREHANAQQIFESLNSTGEPLRDHELIHNYVLMGLSHAEQREIEESFWLPIEQSTGESIADFWRHYLVMTTGREIDVSGGRGVYDAFRHEFPRLDHGTLRALASEWADYAAVYRILLDPITAPDADIARHLGYVGVFGRGMYPLVMRAVFEHTQGGLGKPELIETLEHVQSVLLRRTIVGLGTDRLVARLCRARADGDLVAAIARITPSDERVRIELKFGDLPHPAYVLGRLGGIDSTAEYGIEHIVPVAPGDGWSGDGIREWADYSEDEQNSHRALARSLGNLTLLEDELALRAGDLSFPAKSGSIYPRSQVAQTAEIAGTTAWNTAELSARTVRLTTRFLEIWKLPASVIIDDDGLTPILDAKQRRGWPKGWEREWDYVEYRGEHWEVYDVKYLFDRVFKRLWNDARPAVERYSARRGGPVFTAKAWNGQWHELDDTHFLYMGWDSKYMLQAVQGVLDEADLASEVFVVYSYIGAVM